MPKNNRGMASISRVGSVFLFFSLAAAFFLAAGCAHYPVNHSRDFQRLSKDLER